MKCDIIWALAGLALLSWLLYRVILPCVFDCRFSSEGVAIVVLGGLFTIARIPRHRIVWARTVTVGELLRNPGRGFRNFWAITIINRVQWEVVWLRIRFPVPNLWLSAKNPRAAVDQLALESTSTEEGH